jgi:hypothetical protein
MRFEDFMLELLKAGRLALHILEKQKGTGGDLRSEDE